MATESPSPKTSIEFPGQGAPYNELVRDLTDPNIVGQEAHEIAQEVFEEVHQETGIDVRGLSHSHSTEEIAADTRLAQIVLLAAGYAGGRVLFKKGVSADFYRGHSAAAFTAAGVAGALTLSRAAKLMQKRSAYMHDSATKLPGVVAATDISIEKLIEICERTGAHIANLNSPLQTFISGSRESVERARELIRSEGFRATIFRDWKNGRVHSPEMQEAEDQLRADLATEEVTVPDAQIVKNTDGSSTNDAEEIREDLGGMAKQVRWTDGTLTLLANGVTRFVEVGPKSRKVVSGFLRDHGLEGEVEINHFNDYL